MNKFLPGILLSVLLGSTVSAYSQTCVLPDPEGGDAPPSPPSIEGEIAKIIEGGAVLKDAKATSIRFDEKTKLFTIFGGTVERKELKAGQHVFVWFVDCKAPAAASSIAAVVQLCSKDAEPCPK